MGRKCTTERHGDVYRQKNPHRSRTKKGNTYMLPVSVGADGKLLPTLHEQHTRVADLAGAKLVDSEALVKVVLVALAIGESRTRRLGAADAASLQTAIDLGLVEAEHGFWLESGD